MINYNQNLIHEEDPETTRLTNDISTVLGTSIEQIKEISCELEKRLDNLGSDGDMIRSMLIKLTMSSKAAHTIFGPKPLTAIAWKPYTNLPDPKIITGHEWQAWCRHVEPEKFISPNLVLRKAEGSTGYSEIGELLIYDINKIRKVALDKQDRFKLLLGKSVDPEQVIRTCHKTPTLNSLYSDCDELRGILLGYGQKSSNAFAMGQKTNVSLAPLAEGRENRLNLVRFKMHDQDIEALKLNQMYSDLLPILDDLYSSNLLVGAILGKWIGKF